MQRCIKVGHVGARPLGVMVLVRLVRLVIRRLRSWNCLSFSCFVNLDLGCLPLSGAQAFQQHCEYVRTPRGVMLQPMAALGVGKWLVVFCDEINLPAKVGLVHGASF